MGVVALLAGITAAAVMVASQTGLLGGHDYVVIAAFAAFATLISLVTALRVRGRQRSLALTGLGLSLLPVLLLVFYLATTNG